MIVTLRTERIRTLDEARAFLEGSEPVDFTLSDRDPAYLFVRRSLGSDTTASVSETRALSRPIWPR